MYRDQNMATFSRNRRLYAENKENFIQNVSVKSSSKVTVTGYRGTQGHIPQQRSCTFKPPMGVAAARRTAPLTTINNNVLPHHVSSVESPLYWMDSITVVVKRGRQGYGFALVGGSPVTISRVDVGSTAEQAGLQKGDSIVKINGQNVSQSQADAVARIVRTSEKQIVVDIVRADAGKTSFQQPLVVEVEHHPQPKTSITEQRRPSLPSEISQLPSENDSGLDESVSSTGMSSPCQMSTADSGVECMEVVAEENIRSNIPDMTGSITAQRVSDEMPLVDMQLQSLGSHMEYQRATERLHSLESQFAAEMHDGIRCFAKPLHANIVSKAEHTTLFQNVEQIVDLSDFHVEQLQKHILNHYQNRHDVKQEVGSVYLPQASIMTKTYESYCNGIKNAFRLLKELHEDAEFHHFVKELSSKSSGLSLSQFLQRPLQHIKELVLCLQQLAIHTSVDHYDYDQLKAVVEALRMSCNKIQENNQRRAPSCLSLASRPSRAPSEVSRSSRRTFRSRSTSPRKVYRPLPSFDRESPSRESSSSSQSSRSAELNEAAAMVSIASVDAEVMDIQTRLIFPDYMPAFQLATGTRYMIYSGELLQFDGLLWNRTFVVLLSDLLVVTRPDEENMLVVTEDPVILNNVVDISVEGHHACDFGVRAVEGKPGQKACNLVFQAPSLDLKSTWVHVLEQRIHSCKTQQIATQSNIV